MTVHGVDFFHVNAGPMSNVRPDPGLPRPSPKRNRSPSPIIPNCLRGTRYSSQYIPLIKSRKVLEIK